MPPLSTDPETIALRLRQARDATGLSTREVAAKLEQAGVKVSHATIGNYERAVSVPSIDLLRHIAVLYNRDLEWFLEAGLQPVGIRYRKTASRVKVGEEKQYVANATRWLEAYRRLEQKVGRVLVGRHARFRANPNQSGQSLATHVRERFLTLSSTAPVPSVIAVLEEQFGVRVLELYTESRIDGFAAQFGDEHAVILNPRASNDRIRLNAGHELGHILFFDCGSDTLPHKEIEARAYDFAFHLMMPEPVLREAFSGRSMVKLVKYKEAYGISLAAMVYRAEKAGILSKQDAEWLWRQFSMRGWRQQEPGAVRPDRATRFESMFEEVTTQPDGRLGKTDALKIMGVREEEMQARLDIAAGRMPTAGETANNEEEDEKGGGDPNVIRFPE